jgi:hypothetical protein
LATHDRHQYANEGELATRFEARSWVNGLVEAIAGILAFIALAVASFLWGADSREGAGAGRDRRRRWFIDLE